MRCFKLWCFAWGVAINKQAQNSERSALEFLMAPIVVFCKPPDVSRCLGGLIAAMNLDVCATWSAIQGLQDAMQAVCRAARTLVICDEHHHAAVEAAWGSSADSAFADARYVLILTGTPIRSDREQSVWLAATNFPSRERATARARIAARSTR